MEISSFNIECPVCGMRQKHRIVHGMQLVLCDLENHGCGNFFAVRPRVDHKVNGCTLIIDSFKLGGKK